MQNGIRSGLAALAAAVLAAAVRPARALEAGAAKAVITPDVRAVTVYMAGFGNNRVATGVHDDTYVRCLALRAAGKTLAGCEADQIGLFYDDVLKIRAQAKARAPEITHLIVASSHDHESIDTMGLWGPRPLVSGINERYMDWLDNRIASTAVAAVRSMRKARMTLARDDHPLLALLQSDSRPPYVKDPYLFVMHLTADSGAPLATLVNWSDHPETLGSLNTLITADYPHWLCAYVESHGGGTAVFFNGSIGGLLSTLGDEVALQDPDTGEIAKDGTWLKARLFGNTVGELAMRALERYPQNVDVDSFRIRHQVIFAPLQNDGFRVAGAAGVFAGRKPLYTEGQPDPSVAEKSVPGLGTVKYNTGHDTETEVDYIQLRSRGRVVAEVATIPGEIYPELVNGGLARYPGADYPDAPFEPTLRAHLKSRYQFVFGLANDELGYIIPKCEYDNVPPWLRNHKTRWYGEVNSAGPDVAGAVMNALVRLIEQP